MASRWRSTLDLFKRRETLTMLGLGFASGLPLLLIAATLSVWLRQAGITRSSIGLFSIALLAYVFKWAWAPLVDRLHIPLLSRFGQRRSWMLLAQTAIAIAIASMAFSDPKVDVMHLAIWALILAFSSATLDISIDAWRVESGTSEQQGPLAAAATIGYRTANLVAGAVALYLVDIFSHGATPAGDWAAVNNGWRIAYGAMALLTLVGFATMLLAREPVPRTKRKPGGIAQAFIEAIVDPVVEFIQREKGEALIVLLFVFLSYVSIFVMGPMANPMYVDSGYTPSEIATASKVIGLIVTLVGSIIGGVAIARYGVASVLALGVASLSLPTLTLAWVAVSPHEFWRLAIAIGFDNFANAFGGTVFIAYLSAYTNPAYAATQYAALAAVSQLPGRVIAPFTGNIVDALQPHYGSAGANAVFFTGAALIGVPAIFMAIWCAQLLKRKLQPIDKPAPATA
jgi:PAT family beta-lactamase induction signal transducer AmpG